MKMFRLVGRLMGMAMRSQEKLDLMLPSVFWKVCQILGTRYMPAHPVQQCLVGDEVCEEDLVGIDDMAATSLRCIREIENTGSWPRVCLT